MTVRSSKRWQDFGRRLVLGGFASVTPSRASGENSDEVNALPKREQGPAAFQAGRDASQEKPKASAQSRLNEADRQAIERGENEGMTLHPG